MGWNPRGMRLRFALLLPPAQLLLAVAMWEWAQRAPIPKGLDSPYSPTVDLVSKGINAPAVLSKILTLPFYRTPHWPPSILGLTADEFLFFVGVVITWYLVGRALDRYIHSRGTGRSRMTVGEAIANVLCLALGICFFAAGLTVFSESIRRNNPTGFVALGVLLLVWSVFLVGVPALRLAKRIFRRATTSSSG